MSNLYNTKNEKEKFILVAIDTYSNSETVKMNLDELEELAKTSNVEIVYKFIQKKENIDSQYYLGKGKLNELLDIINTTKATGIICDDELTNYQLKNMFNILNIKIIDRTFLILDIFSKHANSSEGKIQVELAYLKYKFSHLIGIRSNLSKLGSGIGSKGPGEKKLELDKRYIKERINILNKNLKNIENHKNRLRKNRLKNSIPIVSLVGYTNSGKSTLMNCITKSNVLSEDKLFATLETSTRKLKLPNEKNIILNDTIGFIQKLPHNLIKSFKSTLEELKFSDILIHVVDSSNKFNYNQINTVYSILKELNCINKPIITVFNKIDKDVYFASKDDFSIYSLDISAKTGENINKLYEVLEKVLQRNKKFVKVLIPFSNNNLLNEVFKFSEIKFIEYKEIGTYLEAFTNDKIYNKLKKYMLNLQ